MGSQPGRFVLERLNVKPGTRGKQQWLAHTALSLAFESLCGLRRPSASPRARRCRKGCGQCLKSYSRGTKPGSKTVLYHTIFTRESQRLRVHQPFLHGTSPRSRAMPSTGARRPGIARSGKSSSTDTKRKQPSAGWPTAHRRGEEEETPEPPRKRLPTDNRGNGGIFSQRYEVPSVSFWAGARPETTRHSTEIPRGRRWGGL